MLLPGPPTAFALWSSSGDGGFLVDAQAPAGFLLHTAGARSLCDWLALHETGVAIALDDIRAAMSCDAPFSVEATVAGHEGVPMRLMICGLPLTEDGMARRYRGSIVDISEQRRALETAMRSAAECRLLIDNSTDLIAHCDSSGRYVSISPSYSHMIGWSQEQVVGRTVVEFLHPDDRAAGEAALDHLFAGGCLDGAVEVRKRHRQGHFISVGTNARGVFDEAGRCIGAVLISRDISRDKERVQRLETLATHDALTGLPNRAWIVDHVDRLLELSACSTTVFFLDLNGFKGVNDTLGHAAGDLLLKAVADRLQASIRPGDAVARLGGDEFVIASRGASPAAAAAVAQRLLASVAAPVALMGETLQISASIGIAQAVDGTADRDALFSAADAAMYQAKAMGGQGYQFAHGAVG